MKKVSIYLYFLLIIFSMLDCNDVSPVDSSNEYQHLLFNCGPVIFSTNINGSQQKIITGGQSFDFGPKYCSKNNLVVFYSERDNQVYGLYSMDVDGNNQVRLVDATIKGYSIFDDVEWSPSGEYIVYSSPKSGRNQIYIFDIKNKIEKMITKTGENSLPKWSSDGQKIAYVSDNRGDNKLMRIYISDINGENEHPFLKKGKSHNPYWSKDSKKILFNGNLNYDELPYNENTQKTDIYIANSDGSNIVRLTHDSCNGPFGWSQDENYILFNSGRDYNDGIHHDLYIMDTKGSNIKRLTNQGLIINALWSPDGKYIAYNYYTNDLQKPGTGLDDMRSDGSEKRILFKVQSAIGGISWIP